jgi:hypothetical protein
MREIQKTLWLGIAATLLAPSAVQAQSQAATGPQNPRIYLLELENTVDETCGVSDQEARMMAAAVLTFGDFSVETSPRQNDLYGKLDVHLESAPGERGCAGYVSFSISEGHQVQSHYDGLNRRANAIYCDDSRFVAFGSAEEGAEFYNAVRFSVEACIAAFERGRSYGRPAG